MKRAILVAYHFPPIRGSSGVQRTLQFARHLPDHGWQPAVVSVHPRAYPAAGDELLADIPRGVPVVRAFALDSARQLAFRGRYLGATAFPDRWISWWPAGVLACLRLIRQYRPQVIWSTYPVATAHLIGLTVRRLTGLPWVADFRDPMVQPAHRPPRWAGRLWAGLERAVVANASGCVFVTEAMRADYRRRYPERDHRSWSVIENGYAEEVFRAAERARRPAELRGRGIVRLVHSGILYGEGRDPRPFLSALSQVARGAPGTFHVVLRASGDARGHETLVRELGLSGTVEVAPFVEYTEAIRELLEADGLIVFQGSVFNRQVPAKVYEYLRSGRPILALVDPEGETARVLAGWDGVYFARPDSVPEIREALERLVAELRAGKSPARKPQAVLGLSRAARTKELVGVFQRVLPGEGTDLLPESRNRCP